MLHIGSVAATQAMDTCICMGASIGAAHGMEKARAESLEQKLLPYWEIPHLCIRE